MKKTEIQTVMKLWELNYSAGDFLVIYFSVDKKQTKVVRYSDTEKNTKYSSWWKKVYLFIYPTFSLNIYLWEQALRYLFSWKWNPCSCGGESGWKTLNLQWLFCIALEMYPDDNAKMIGQSIPSDFRTDKRNIFVFSFPPEF